LIDIGTEFNVIEHVLGIWSLVFKSKSGEFVLSQVEIEHRKDTFELCFGDLSLSQFIEIVEEFFNSNSLHDDVMLESLLDIIRVV
jgi:hypothetical protein